MAFKWSQGAGDGGSIRPMHCSHKSLYTILELTSMASNEEFNDLIERLFGAIVSV